ncbi:uncharacterized protein Pyn_34461 [Prunus yedoensis var. nudiflora]|uniref:Uncharacterized protein n=1 Tax=Prunus yedoensis var. nudiflora TaxID=2094558 RepID=A0A314UPR1_PRUYE|nr:uncharacterized protein Pyn_34461 [Prunus yedoensis var. nudiflora]
METTTRRVRRRQRSRNLNENKDTLTISENIISVSGGKEVGIGNLFNKMNDFVLTAGRGRSIVIARNEIKADKSSSVGIGNLFNNYCNLSVVVIFLVVVVALIPLGLWIKWATRPTTLLTQGLHIIEKEHADMGLARDTVAEIGMKWTRVLRTGARGVRFMGVDLNTIMFNMERGQDTTESPVEGVCVEPTRGQ